MLQKRTFYSCTNENSDGRFWCATTGNYDEDAKWSYCADTRLSANSQGPCVFPFIYRGKSYSSCTTDGASKGQLWCSLTSNYDESPKWTYCKPSEPLPCHFPFIYNGKSYSACTKDGSPDNQPWCATTANYDSDKKWRACALQDYEGNLGGQACVFPFIYKKRTFYNCTNENSDGRFWCATTGNYDEDAKWSYCSATRLSANSQGPCVFPFIYHGKSYSSCTADGASKGQLWCSLTNNYDESPKWMYCKTSEYGGNSGGQPCVFPFIYRKRTFYSCTNENSDGRFWCATTGNYDEDAKWSYCADTKLNDGENKNFVSSPHLHPGLSANSQGPCVFPFIYRGKSYSSCTTDGASKGQLWCSLTSNYDESPKWTYCKPSEPLPCHFPFIYNGKSYSACTKDGSPDNQPWCATTANYDSDKKWRACALQEYGGNSGGQPCVFPFIYRKRTFYSCTNENSDGRFWCATTGNYDEDAKWSYCADTRLSANSQGPCVFPFIYRGKSYSSCTTDGASKGQLWCSLTSNYDESPKWTYCKPSEPLPCHFPFIYNGKSYSACTKDGSPDNQPWCATTANYDSDKKWRACALQDYEGNLGGQACVFPFIYKKRTFYNCTNENSDGRFWCATTGNYDEDAKWSYCSATRLSANSQGPCVFPFIYHGKSYSSCTADGASKGQLWCSLTNNYDESPKWMYCKTSDTPSIEEWGMKVMQFAEMNKLTTLLEEKSTDNFMKNWKPIIDVLHERENNELTCCGFED
ncbi:uncharacterized protein [Tiliqua scincoides]|uniref:uncharacterized protein n=1 Tax=Tiliqua scincoides TaxID=71010 RepID=UPI003461B38C